MTATTLLDISGITKRFGPLTANDSVHLTLEKGEIHALLGENGAGKSTLVKMLYGALQPDAGTINWHGEPIHIRDPAAARRLGIGMVFQHFSLFDALTVAENIALAMPPGRGLAGIAQELAETSKAYGLSVDAQSHIADLSAGQRQRAEIVRCLMQHPELIILDEPTSVLTPQEADDLFVTLERLASEGRAILYISHKLDEVRRLCHRATILRHGKVVAHCSPAEETPASLARLMVGADIHEINSTLHEGGETVLVLEDLSAPSPNPFGTDLHNINLELQKGQISCIAGIAGNGQNELFDALSGELGSISTQSVSFKGQAIGHMGINARRRLGMAFVSEERNGHGAAPSFSLSENVFLTRVAKDRKLAPMGILNRFRSRAIKERVCEEFDVRRGVNDPEARQLSGGNLQKFIMGREIDSEPELIVINQPTWGVDAGAAARIRQVLANLADKGVAVLVISQDLDEIFEIADRVAVLDRGHLSPFVSANDTDREAIGLLMGGRASADTQAEARIP